MRHSMKFHSCKKQIFKSFCCTEICNDSKWTKTSRREVMQPKTSNSNSRPTFNYHVHQVLAIPILTKEAFFTWAFWRWVGLFNHLQEFKVAYQWRQLERLIIYYTPVIVDSRRSRFKILEFKSLWNVCSP